jgi:hypothetical protein
MITHEDCNTYSKALFDMLSTCILFFCKLAPILYLRFMNGCHKDVPLGINVVHQHIVLKVFNAITLHLNLLLALHNRLAKVTLIQDTKVVVTT